MKLAAEKGWLFILPWAIEKTGGVNRVVWELSKETFRTGNYHPFIFIPDWDCHGVVTQEIDFYTEMRFRLYTPAFESINCLPFLKFLIRLPFEVNKTIKIIKKHNIRVVNFHYVGGLTPLIFAIIKIVSKVEFRLILSFHGSDLLALEKKTKIFRKLFQFILHKTDNIVCCSKGLSLQFQKLFPAFHEKIKFIHNGIADLFISNPSLTTIENEIPKELNGKSFILTVGTFEKKKGHDILLKAFFEIKNSGSNLSLVIIGQSGPEFENIERLIGSFGLTDFVFTYKNLPPEKLIAFYDTADMFVSSSRYEPFGLVLIEAGARRLPVVATKTMGALEIIENNQSGLLVEKENAEALATAIQYLIDNPDIGRLFAENLRERVLSEFKWQTAWEKYSQLASEKPIVELIL